MIQQNTAVFSVIVRRRQEKMREEDYLSWIKEFLNGRRLFLEKALRRQREVRS